MIISPETTKALNGLVGSSFEMNAFADNVAYNLDYMGYDHISEIFHLYFAHAFPELSDKITDFMKLVHIRAVRLAVPEYSADYQSDIQQMFADVVDRVEEYRKSIISCIDIAEFNDDVEVKIFLEEFLIKFIPYVKQAEVWYQYIAKTSDIQQLNDDFSDISGYLPIVKADED